MTIAMIATYLLALIAITGWTMYFAHNLKK